MADFPGELDRPQGSAPTLVSSSPAQGARGVLPSASVTFTVTAPTGINIASLASVLGGAQAVSVGAINTPYSGSIVRNGDGSVTVAITGHPDLPAGLVTDTIAVSSN